MKFFLFLLLFSSLSFSQSWEDVSSLIYDHQNKLFTHSDTLVSKSNENIFDFKTGERSVFDLASLTKVVATTTAVMILIERGKLRLNDKLYKFIPGFNVKRKNLITIEDLLRHQAGFKSGLPFDTNETYLDYIKRITKEPLSYTPRTRMIYSDLSFIILGVIIEKVAKKSLESFCQDEIFKPLEMNDTGFNPLKNLKEDCVPTLQNRTCLAHDPTAAFFYPQSLGHAGLFSTKNDLAIFLRMLVNDGVSEKQKILSQQSIKLMTSLSEGKERGLGWDISSQASVNPRGDYFPKNISFGHTGYTGTTLWIDQDSKTFYIFLSNRTFLGDDQTRSPFGEFRKKLSNKIGMIIFSDL